MLLTFCYHAASTLDYEKYPKLFAAGGLCASITHLVTVPLDVVKTRCGPRQLRDREHILSLARSRFSCCGIVNIFCPFARGLSLVGGGEQGGGGGGWLGVGVGRRVREDVGEARVMLDISHVLIESGHLV